MANGLSPLEGRSFIVGRAGHVLVRGTTVSNQHAEIKFEKGRILLRDLNSTNGLFMVTDQGRKRFRQSYVTPNQVIYLGTEKTSVQDLLDIIYSLTL
ncbi:MAG TPA: FHA domain-containing protein [Gammaproteobacteria bacterium]|nr:FHA domain-containing protein [Gammaproteobacteria bacterium]